MIRRQEDILAAYRKMAREGLERAYGATQHLPKKTKEALKEIFSNTTIAAATFMGKHGSRPTILGCDGRMTQGYEIVSDTEDKIDRLDRHSAMATTGYAAPSMVAARYLRAMFRIARLLDKKELSAKGKARQVNDLVGQHFSCDDYFFLPLFVAWDAAQKRARIFDIWGGGGYREFKDFYANGCGGDAAMEELRREWSDALTRNEAINLMVRAIHVAAHRTGGANEPQYVRIVDADGIQNVPKKIIQRTLDAIRKTCGECKKQQDGGVQ